MTQVARLKLDRFRQAPFSIRISLQVLNHFLQTLKEKELIAISGPQLPESVFLRTSESVYNANPFYLGYLTFPAPSLSNHSLRDLFGVDNLKFDELPCR